MKKRMNSSNIEIEMVKVTAPQNSDGAHVANECAFCGLLVSTDGSNDVTLTVYDNASAAAGDKLLPDEITVPGVKELWHLELNKGIHAANGVYVAFSGTGAYVQVLYQDGT